MALLLTMPSLSPTMETGVITAWRKNAGDFIDVGEVLAEIETDKAVMDYEMADEGYIREFLVEPGQEVAVGTPIAILSETEDEDISELQAQAKSDAAAAPPAAAPEPAPAAAAPAAATPEAPSAAAAPATPVAAAPAASAPPPPAAPTGAPGTEAPAEATPSNGDGRVRISPFARKLAEQQGLNWQMLSGSGPGGRIVAKDVEAAITGGVPAAAAPASQAPADTPVAGSAPAPAVLPPAGPLPPFEDEPLSMMRKAIARTMATSKQTVPHFQTSRKVRMEKFLAMREQLKAQFPDVRISLNDMIIKASAVALRQHPVVNSQFLEDRIRRFNTVDISVAVATEEGLITPVVRNVEQKGLTQIATEVRALAELARERKLAPEQYLGGTFTISNLGMFGIYEFNAIINPPQAAILAVAGVNREPVVEGDAVVPGQTMNITLSADHRVVDGVAAAQFLATLAAIIENPLAMLM